MRINETSVEFLCIDCMACVWVGNDVSEWFLVNVGLRPGCVMYLGCLMSIWTVLIER